MAKERTFLTYLRISLIFIGFGLAIIQLHFTRGAAWYGALAVTCIMLLIGWLRFRTRRREIEER
jgi:uncharacterized membrane protein YidH (DUF202 family)